MFYIFHYFFYPNKHIFFLELPAILPVCIPFFLHIMQLFLLRVLPFPHSLLSLAYIENLLHLPLNLDYENDNLISSVSSESYTPLLRLSFSPYYENYPYIRPKLLFSYKSNSFEIKLHSPYSEISFIPTELSMMSKHLYEANSSSTNAKAYEKDF